MSMTGTPSSRALAGWSGSVRYRASWVRGRLMSSAPSHFDTTTVAMPLPIGLVSARASDMKRSTPRINAIAAGILGAALEILAAGVRPGAVAA